ncbi:MAG: hypothetical protein WKG07_27105 [Hymenobacter sp.]
MLAKVGCCHHPQVLEAGPAGAGRGLGRPQALLRLRPQGGVGPLFVFCSLFVT